MAWQRPIWPELGKHKLLPRSIVAQTRQSKPPLTGIPPRIAAFPSNTAAGERNSRSTPLASMNEVIVQPCSKI
jgi:hypothetical protein